MQRRRARISLLTAGSLLVLAGLALLLAARVSIGTSRWVYVSEMGAPDMATAGTFRVALLLVAAGGTLTAIGAWSVRTRLLRALPPAVVVLLASGCFALASQVTCTAGCPLPVGPTFSWQDLVHTSAAVLGFAAACLAMLQLSTARERPGVARLSLVAGITVAVVAGIGAMLSLLRVWMGVGGTLEFVATAIAVLWLAIVGSVLALEELSAARASRARARGSAPADGRDPRRGPGPARMPHPEEI
ncbi:DUF998 domain-containing protein [Rathayibacter sp. VKM Ac-2754]|uniref:DUF998 domain-containing protein n=1 Tax=Rathayibacter sp. VKM Ac-2754 TaxID=2609251 RepID=UPI001356D955|nr:DUF998 domain-containing protein [Rathayibacter sp. VKM Ac-2754]MWV58417.1 DUF998 domain-containing protein [Rathayibacter sp. VKM Ac-2754]